MTSQQVFNLILLHLRTQQAKSVRTIQVWKRQEIECALRGDEGRKCPAGLFIRDDEYDAKQMEGWTFSSILADKKCPKGLKDRHTEHIDLIEACCFLHDFSRLEDFEEELSFLASTFGLSYVAPIAAPTTAEEIASEEVAVQEIVLPALEEVIVATPELASV